MSEDMKFPGDGSAPGALANRGQYLEFFQDFIK